MKQKCDPYIELFSYMYVDSGVRLVGLSASSIAYTRQWKTKQLACYDTCWVPTYAQQYSPSRFLTSRTPSRSSNQSVSSGPGTIHSDRNSSVRRWTVSFSRTAEIFRIPLHETEHRTHARYDIFSLTWWAFSWIYSCLLASVDVLFKFSNYGFILARSSVNC